MSGTRMTTISSSGSQGQRMTFLAIVAIAGAVILSLVMFFVLQSLIAPRLLAGTLSEAVPQPCIEGKQWVLYSCKPNPLTGLGCIVPGSNGKYITYKTVAVQNTSCLPGPNGEESGQRIISKKWQLIDATECSTSATSKCCDYNGTCTRTASYYCKRTDQSDNGENQCTPFYLPAPFPKWSKFSEYTETDPAKIQIPCRENFCGTKP